MPEQFGAQYMHNFDDIHPTRPGLETSNSEFRATTGPNKSSRPDNIILPAACISWRMCFDKKINLYEHDPLHIDNFDIYIFARFFMRRESVIRNNSSIGGSSSSLY